MKAFALTFVFLLGAALRANPVAMPTLVMTAENVIVGVSQEIITVEGTYRFHVIPDLAPDARPDRFPIHVWMRLPIPVPQSEKVGARLMSETNPQLIFHGTTIKPEDTYGIFSTLPVVDGVKFMAVEFDIGNISVPEIEVTIKYTQRVIRRDGKMWAYYMPLIEGFESYEKPLGLKSSSYAVSFEAHNGASIKLRSKWTKILQATSVLISVEPRNREVLEVEIMPNQYLRGD